MQGMYKTEPKSLCSPRGQLKQVLCMSKAHSSNIHHASKANLCQLFAPVCNCLLHIRWWALVTTVHSPFPPPLQLPRETAASPLTSPLGAQWVHQAFCQVRTFTHPSPFPRAEAAIGLEVWKAPVQKSLSSKETGLTFLFHLENGGKNPTTQQPSLYISKVAR